MNNFFALNKGGGHKVLGTNMYSIVRALNLDRTCTKDLKLFLLLQIWTSCGLTRNEPTKWWKGPTDPGDQRRTVRPLKRHCWQIEKYSSMILAHPEMNLCEFMAVTLVVSNCFYSSRNMWPFKSGNFGRWIFFFLLLPSIWPRMNETR